MRKTPDVTFIGEEGIDANGLTKEFCHLVMNALKNGKGGYILFEGKQDHLVPIICEEYNQSGYFHYIGMLIAMSVLHGGCGFLGLSRALSSYMVSDDIITASADLTIDDVPDYAVQEALTQVRLGIKETITYKTNHQFREFSINNAIHEIKQLKPVDK